MKKLFFVAVSALLLAGLSFAQHGKDKKDHPANHGATVSSVAKIKMPHHGKVVSAVAHKHHHRHPVNHGLVVSTVAHKHPMVKRHSHKSPLVRHKEETAKAHGHAVPQPKPKKK